MKEIQCLRTFKKEELIKTTFLVIVSWVKTLFSGLF